MVIDPWKDPKFAALYAKEAANPVRGWYEHEVNFPSLLTLMPQSTQRILDFGSGPGDFTSMFAKHYADIEGCDNSQAMIDIAKETYKTINFFVWDFHNDLPDGHGPYDVVVSKLTVQFIKELDVFAAKMSSILKPGGSLLISVSHPVHAAKQVEDYWQEVSYKQQIGKYDIYDMMIHRSLERYVNTFLDSGFVLTGLAEPRVEQATIETYNVDPVSFRTPKRLNLRFKNC